jgi:hypothetical protein
MLKANKLKCILIIGYSVSLSLCTPSSVYSQDEEVIDGRITFVEGTVRKMVSSSEGWLTIAEGTVIGLGDSIKTLEDSKVEFSLKNNGNFRLGPSSCCFIGMDLAGYFIYPDLASGNIWARFEYEENEDYWTLPRIMLPTIEVWAIGGEARFTSAEDCTSEIKSYKEKLYVERRLWYGYRTREEGMDFERHLCEADSTMPDSLAFWSVTLDEGERLITSSRGYIVFRGAFGPDDPDEQTEWVRWNLERDK